jgi:hypothetical protein
MTRRTPNFFIVGAPKTATTALSQYLAEHPRVFMSRPKEPAFWNTDHPWSREIFEIYSLEDYLELFQRADPATHLAIGEGSTAYLQSREAIDNIMRFEPGARIIAMLRSPIEVAHAMHGELCRKFREDVMDFEAAWRLQEARARGESLPDVTVVRHQFQYGDVASFAPQIRRIIAAVPAEQRLFLIYDDFAADPGATYRRVLGFLGLPDDARTRFPIIRPSRAYRSERLGRLYMTPPASLDRPIRLVRDRYQALDPRIRRVLSDFVIGRREPREPLRPEFVAELRSFFAADVAEVSALLDRDLSGWLDPQRTARNDRS